MIAGLLLKLRGKPRPRLLLDEYERTLSIECLARISYDTKEEPAMSVFAPISYVVRGKGGKVLRGGRFARRVA